MDSAWEILIPYECEVDLYKAFVKAALATSEKNRRIIRNCWTGVPLPKGCLPADAFEKKDFDTALALATQNKHLDSWYDWKITNTGVGREYLNPREHSYLFDRCIQSRKFMVTALNLSPWLYDHYDSPPGSRYSWISQEYCELAMRRSVGAWKDANMYRFPVRKNYDLRKRMLSLDPRSFTSIFWETERCSDREFILGSAPFYLDLAEYFAKRCHPDVFDWELCEELCKIGFPIWVVKPDIAASFLRKFQSFTELPPLFANDRKILESVAKNNCKILGKATPEFRKDISLVISIFKHNPGVLHYCDPSIFTDEKFLGRFRKALRKPNRFFSRTKPSTSHPGLNAFPMVLQTQELALIAVESCGEWIHYFPRFWTDYKVVKAAVVTWPLAYSYAPIYRITRYNWSERICKINPRAVWAAENRFINGNRSIVHKALRLGPLLNGHDYFPFQAPLDLVARNFECILPDILRADACNYETLCLKEINRHFILRRKKLIIAALEGTRDGSILWDVPADILDRDIWNKAREVR